MHANTFVGESILKLSVFIKSTLTSHQLSNSLLFWYTILCTIKTLLIRKKALEQVGC